MGTLTEDIFYHSAIFYHLVTDHKEIYTVATIWSKEDTIFFVVVENVNDDAE